MNLEHPRIYNEKLRWINLRDRNPLMAQCCDKYAVREYVESKGRGEALLDYKIFCFNGEPKMVYVDTWHDGEHHVNAYDTGLNLFEGVKLGYSNDEKHGVKKPESLEEMFEVAKALSQDFHHVRVDLYYTHGKILFGELAFTKGADFGKIEPTSFDVKMGDWLKLPCDEVA